MVSILIKSFNRPYYLDRCLQSIARFVEGDYTVTILDDGTPERYLQRITKKHPLVNIIKSSQYSSKIKAIEENLTSGKEIDGFSIPTTLWCQAVRDASNYFIMTEDDVWFTTHININNLEETCKQNNISLLKLGWLGNQKDLHEVDVSEISAGISRTIPKKLLLLPKPLNGWFFYNKYKFYSLLYKLHFVDNTTKQKYWALNSILMGFWQKDYWLHIWKDAKGKVDEKQQLQNAASFYRKNKKNINFLAKINKEAMKTTFQSSATNSYHKYGEDFDVNYFNHIINEAWLDESFDAMQNFPKDFSLDYFEQFIHPLINLTAYQSWVQKFKNQYKKLGCDVG